jgi:hypothetical protein
VNNSANSNGSNSANSSAPGSRNGMPPVPQPRRRLQPRDRVPCRPHRSPTQHRPAARRRNPSNVTHARQPMMGMAMTRVRTTAVNHPLTTAALRAHRAKADAAADDAAAGAGAIGTAGRAAFRPPKDTPVVKGLSSPATAQARKARAWPNPALRPRNRGHSTPPSPARQPKRARKAEATRIDCFPTPPRGVTAASCLQRPAPDHCHFLAACRTWLIVASRAGKRGQIVLISRRIAGLCNEKSGQYGPLLRRRSRVIPGPASCLGGTRRPADCHSRRATPAAAFPEFWARLAVPGLDARHCEQAPYSL